MPKRYKIIICMKTVVNAVNFIPKDSKCFFLKFAICIGKLWACAYILQNKQMLLIPKYKFINSHFGFYRCVVHALKCLWSEKIIHFIIMIISVKKIIIFTTDIS